VAYLADDDWRATSDRRQHVDAITVVQRLRRVDELAIDRQAHALEEGRERREPIDDSAAQLDLGNAFGSELERRALASRKVLGGGIVVNADFHGTRKA